MNTDSQLFPIWIIFSTMSNFYSFYNIFSIIVSNLFRMKMYPVSSTPPFLYATFCYPSFIWCTVTLTRGFAVHTEYRFALVSSFPCHLTEFMIMSSIFNPCRNYDWFDCEIFLQIFLNKHILKFVCTYD